MDRVLIVEDIPSVRTYIVRLLQDYGCPDVKLVASVGNGVEAMEVIEREQIDILITDMFMPQMNGVQLMEKAMEKQPMMKAIVISAYDQYTYVRSAMRLNACEYLLKPISKKDFDAALDQVREKLRIERQDAQHLKALMREREMHAKSAQLQRCLETGQPDIWLQQLGKKWTLAVVISAPALYSSTEFQRLLASDHLCAFYTSDKPIRVAVLFDVDSDVPIRSWIRRVVGLSAEMHLSAYFSYVSGQEVRGDFQKGWYVARDKLHARFLDSPESQSDDEEVHYLTEKDVLYIECTLPNQNEDDIRTTVARYFSHVKADKARSYPRVWDFMQQFQRIYQSICKSYSVDYLSSANNCHNLTLSDCIDLDDAQKLVTDQFVTLSHQVKKDKSGSTARIVHQIQEHIKRNCAEEIKLYDLAKMLYLSEDYLGKIFRDVTGESFSVYLTKVRMERAYDLIVNTDMKVTDVAAAVGYNSTSNFISIFKKQYGETPVNLRKKTKNN